MAEAFFVPDGDRFVPTEWTRGPWDPNAQHAGPAAALAGRVFERLDPGPQLQVARFTFEVLRPIPVEPLAVEAAAVRSGRRVQFCLASLVSGGEEIARASAWRIRPGPENLPVPPAEPAPHPGPEGLASSPIFDPWGGPSYFSAMDWRVAAGAWGALGPAAVWMGMRVALVEGEEPSALSRVLTAADSANGISNVLPWDRFVFINTELTVHLSRLPRGEWVCIDATSRVEPNGVGVAESVLWDGEGRIGSGAQTLLAYGRGGRTSRRRAG